MMFINTITFLVYKEFWWEKRKVTPAQYKSEMTLYITALLVIIVWVLYNIYRINKKSKKDK